MLEINPTVRAIVYDVEHGRTLSEACDPQIRGYFVNDRDLRIAEWVLAGMPLEGETYERAIN